MLPCSGLLFAFVVWTTAIAESQQSVIFTIIDCGSEVQVMSHVFTPSHPVSDFGLTVEVKFIPKHVIASVTGNGTFTALVSREKVEFFDKDGCRSSGLNCPVPAGKVASYKKFLPIPARSKTWDQWSSVQYTLYDENKKTIVCMNASARKK